MKKCLAIILALVMAFGCMSVAAFAAGSPDLSMLTTGKKIMFGTQSSNAVEWVIGGDGTTGMSVPTGCIALVSSGLVASVVSFSGDRNNEYAPSNLGSVVKNAVTFTTDEQALITSRTLGSDDIAGDPVIAAVWAPTTNDAYGLKEAGLSKVGQEYWLCSPGSSGSRVAYVDSDGNVDADGNLAIGNKGARAALYLDLSKVYGAEAVSGAENTYTLVLTAPEEDTFLTSITLTKDYDDRYNSGSKSTAVSETVTYTVTPITENAPAFTSSTFSMAVTDGVGSAEITLPTTITKAGDYWYSITETGGKTAGVTYDTNTYYLHLITDCKGDEFGILSAQVHKTAPGSDGTYTNEASDKITGFTNSYAEGTLKICQETLIDGSHNDYDEFEATVTFTLPEGTEITGDITYGDNQTVTFENGVGTAVITLKDGESVEFTGIPDGVTYTVEQTEGNENKGFELESVAFDNEETGDSVTNNIASGTIGDAQDVLTITNTMETATDVGVIVEYTAFVLLALAAVAAGAWLVISRRRKAIDAE